ncbi:hypothetical protein DPM13_07890 [Paracoccus mutanolyticus]|uniref:Uncharacterized protein n=1 Tax=Paracoccus mutanolyticus TaxID=1499308 RepID=A0ABM6WR38_9RHOB|nr:hypothetical protein DPM13_07890 [Paracoccus mutanolyticus]
MERIRVGDILFRSFGAIPFFFFVNVLDVSGGTGDSDLVRFRANFVDLDITSTARAICGRAISA